MNVEEYEQHYTEHTQLLGLRDEYTSRWTDAYLTRDWKKMKFYDRLLVEIEEELETL